jgi:hypothetical protein
MLLKGAVPVLVVLAACAHPAVRTQSAAGQPKATSATAAPGPASPTPAPAPAVGTAGSRVDFARDVQPILLSRCMPCHFAGGKMYERLPFNRAATIRELGPKLFTRIKDEKEQDVIRRFLAQPD